MAPTLEVKLKLNLEELEKTLDETGLLIVKDGEYFVSFPRLIEFIKSGLVKVSILPDGPPDPG